jgi:PDZ domain-containing secreted protein
VVSALVAIGLAYHPGTLVVRPEAPIDITDDVRVQWRPTRPPRGRYVLTSVAITEPNLFGLAAAYVRREHLVPNDHPSSPPSREEGREEFRASQREAARLLGIDPSDVTFRRRDVIGPSAGLVYALLLADVTGRIDVPKGRVIAATGAVGDGGRVAPVAFVDVKRRVATGADADLFLVPAGEQRGDGGGGVRVVAVPTFGDAERAAVAR